MAIAKTSKLLSTIIRIFQILGTLFAIGVSTYFVIKIARDRDHKVDGKLMALEILSGAAFLYCLFILLPALFLLQKSFFQSLTLLMDLLFMGAFIVIAVLLRNASNNSCPDIPNLAPVPGWLATSNWGSKHCKVVKGYFGTAIGLAVLFFLTAILALLAHSQAKQERPFGPGPRNNYTSGLGRGVENDAELGVAHPEPDTTVPVVNPKRRMSQDTAYTEKASTIGRNSLQATAPAPGREYYRNSQPPNTLSPSAAYGVGHTGAAPARSVSPIGAPLQNENVEFPPGPYNKATELDEGNMGNLHEFPPEGFTGHRQPSLPAQVKDALSTGNHHAHSTVVRG